MNTNQRHYMLSNESTDNHISWIHVANASLRIEAVLSGQAVLAENITQTMAVQPPSTGGGYDPVYAAITPIPHTVVVIKHGPATRLHVRGECRTRRAGRISRQFMEKYLTRDTEEDDCICCASLFGRHNQPPRFIGTPVLC